MAESGLNDLQVEVLRLFFSHCRSWKVSSRWWGRLGSGWIVQPPYRDLDLFSASASVEQAGNALEAAVLARNWTSEVIQGSQTFQRIVVITSHGDRVLVDLARDTPPIGPATITAVGPSYPPVELAARKLLALFDRAALRDFVDVANVSQRYGKDELLGLAAEIDVGFSPAMFAQMLTTLDRFTDDEIRLMVDPSMLRAFFSTWAKSLRRDAQESG